MNHAVWLIKQNDWYLLFYWYFNATLILVLLLVYCCIIFSFSYWIIHSAN